jgi:hypothetical protein
MDEKGFGEAKKLAWSKLERKVRNCRDKRRRGSSTAPEPSAAPLPPGRSLLQTHLELSRGTLGDFLVEHPQFLQEEVIRRVFEEQETQLASMVDTWGASAPTIAERLGEPLTSTWAIMEALASKSSAPRKAFALGDLFREIEAPLGEDEQPKEMVVVLMGPEGHRRAGLVAKGILISLSSADPLHCLLLLLATTYVFGLLHTGPSARFLGFFHQLFKLSQPYEPGKTLSSYLPPPASSSSSSSSSSPSSSSS